MEKRSVSIKVFREEYTLKTDLPQADIEIIAAMVDERMNRISKRNFSVSTSKLAVWSALDLAGELYTLQKKYERLLEIAKYK